jgi:hypothetical protein
MEAIGFDAVEVEHGVGFDEVVVRSYLRWVYVRMSVSVTRERGTYLNRTITLVRDLDPNPLPTCVELYRLSLRGDNSTRPVSILIKRIIEGREIVVRRHGKVAPIECFAKITFVAADGLGNSDQVRARDKGSFDLQLLERRKDAWVDVSAAEDLLAEGHQVRD